MIRVLIINADGSTDERTWSLDVAPIHASHEAVFNGNEPIIAIEILEVTL